MPSGRAPAPVSLALTLHPTKAQGIHETMHRMQPELLAPPTLSPQSTLSGGQACAEGRFLEGPPPTCSASGGTTAADLAELLAAGGQYHA